MANFLGALIPLAWIAFVVWMVVDAIKRGVAHFWIFIIVFVPFGAFIYFFMVKLQDPTSLQGFRKLLERPPSLAEMRRRYEASQTVVNRVAYAQALHDTGHYEEALGHFAAVVERDPDDREALYGQGISLLALNRAEEGIFFLRRVVKLDPAFRDNSAARDLGVALSVAGHHEEALEKLRNLYQDAPRMSHAVLYAQALDRAGRAGEVRKLLEDALLSQRDLPPFIRKRERRWMGEARRMLRKRQG